MPTRYNSDIYRGTTASSVDAACVATLRASGALILGKTHTTEFAATTEGGPCVNPHDIKHTPGGSSSGSAAAVADFQVPLALGTQTGGSIVRPASYNGIYGFKPTWGAISREGLAQYSITCDTAGFLARNVDDFKLLAKVYDFEDIPSNKFGAKIGFLKTHIWDLAPAGPGLQGAWAKAKDLLSQHGVTVEEIEWPDADFEKLTKWHSVIMNGEGRSAFYGRMFFFFFFQLFFPALIDVVLISTQITWLIRTTWLPSWSIRSKTKIIYHVSSFWKLSTAPRAYDLYGTVSLLSTMRS